MNIIKSNKFELSTIIEFPSSEIMLDIKLKLDRLNIHTDIINNNHLRISGNLNDILNTINNI